LTHPAIRDLFQDLARQASFQELARRLAREGGRLSLSGLAPAAKPIYLVLLWQTLQRPLLVVSGSGKRADELFGPLTAFFGLLAGGREAGRPLLVPALDVLPFQKLAPHSEISAQRAVALWRLAAGRVPVTVTPAAAALLKLESGAFYRQLALRLQVGDELALEDLVAHLASIGYERREPVEMAGEYSVRGGIIDVCPAEAPTGLRIEMFGDFIESMRRFDPETQRSVLKVEEALVLPLLEQPRGRPAMRPPQTPLIALFENAVVVWDEPEEIADAAGRLWDRLEEHRSEMPGPPEQSYFRLAEFQARCQDAASLELRELTLDGAAPGAFHIPSRPAMSFHGNMSVAVAETRNLVERGGRVAFFAASTGELERLADVMAEYSVPFQLGLDPAEPVPPHLAERTYLAGPLASTFLIKGAVRRGVVFPDSALTLFGFDDLFDSSELVARPADTRARLAAFTADLADLTPGDHVVHTTHGVGRFLGLRELGEGEQRGDFMLLEYAAEAKLYVPLTRMDLVHKYRGAGGAPPLDKLGGVTWTRTKSRVKARMRDMADELLKLHAERKLAEGFAYSPDSNWQREFEDAFEYTDTRDQAAAIRDIKRDLESPQPMDRLLCGDVGYGKTEVAMRAAFKALGDGRQVAVLAPTTVLSFQHYETFRTRFAAFPVNIELLSRFRTAKEQKAVLADLAAGKVDIVIGTHRLLSQDVEFRELGLLVVDEEQRFGVRHKERLKQLKKNVDVLTMTATPIPRTLHMSLLGMRDMSVIETPPKDRLSIHTVVARFQKELIRAAIEQELSRGGQVYYIHNRVDSIWERAAVVQALVPPCRIGVGHGQMGEAALEKVLLGFMRHEFDVFVSTTIVENGLDIPLANTIIIENAERYGLSELYQLRGRVGRSNRRAYAYLLVPEDTELSEVARKRLAALKEFSDLGAGFKIAALDLELRGAGNLLGGEQHGQITTVGFDMYVRLLEETVQNLKGEETPLEIHSTLSLGLDIRIPADYIAEEHQRLRAYKRIAEAGSRERAEELLAELGDRYGAPPEAVRTLAEFSLLKTLAQKLGVESVERRQGLVNVKFHSESRIDPMALMDLVRTTPGAQFTPAGVLRLPAEATLGAAHLLAQLKTQLERL
jgi:transcription-repair coupling factor (superfamily II helicase)